MTAPTPSPSPGWNPPPEIPDWFVRASEDPSRALSNAMLWLIVTVVVLRIIKQIFTEIHPIQLSPEKTKRASKAAVWVFMAVLVGAIIYMTWILGVLIRDLP